MPLTRPSRWMLGACLTVLLAGAEARADACARVVDAFTKGGKEKRAALVNVEDAHVGTGAPIRIFTPEAYYQDDFKGGFVKSGPMTNELGMLAESIRAGQKAGKVTCNVLGPDTFVGRKVTKVGYIDPNVDALIAKQTVWIEDATGLPVLIVIGDGRDGFGWLYGDAVKAPATSHAEVPRPPRPAKKP